MAQGVFVSAIQVMKALGIKQITLSAKVIYTRHRQVGSCDTSAPDIRTGEPCVLHSVGGSSRNSQFDLNYYRIYTRYWGGM